MALQEDVLDKIAPLGHTIIALSAPPAVGADTQTWVDYIEKVSGAIEQRGVVRQQEQSNQYSQETNKKLDQLIRVTSQNGQPIVTLDGSTLMTQLEKKVTKDSNRHGSVPFYLQKSK